jgi:DnaJ-class molecular chaperone
MSSNKREHCHLNNCGSRLRTCAYCNGKGRVYDKTCPTCKGSGLVCPVHGGKWQ